MFSRFGVENHPNIAKDGIFLDTANLEQSNQHIKKQFA